MVVLPNAGAVGGGQAGTGSGEIRKCDMSIYDLGLCGRAVATAVVE
jgi:hypothetical protein